MNSVYRSPRGSSWTIPPWRKTAFTARRSGGSFAGVCSTYVPSARLPDVDGRQRTFTTSFPSAKAAPGSTSGTSRRSAIRATAGSPLLRMVVSETLSAAITSAVCRVVDRTVSRSIRAITGTMDLFANAVVAAWVEVRPGLAADLQEQHS